jgi:phosphopentomutase
MVKQEFKAKGMTIPPSSLEVTGKDTTTWHQGIIGIMIHLPARYFLRLYHLGPEKNQEYSSQKKSRFSQ